jgi:antirestriction protein ArdC
MQAERLFESVIARIIAELEKGAVPWVKPWKNGNGGIMPINAATFRHYTGINVLILWAEREEKGYPTAQWVTFKQAQEKGACIRKGEKGTHVVFAKPLTFNEDAEEERKIFMHRVYTVFNAAQIEGLTEHQPTPDLVDKPDGHINQFIEATGADIRIGGDMAGYIPSKDYITLPPASAFKSMESYYSTCFHELGHYATFLNSGASRKRQHGRHNPRSLRSKKTVGRRHSVPLLHDMRNPRFFSI